MLMSWADVQQEILSCQNCTLYQGCRQKVMGQGDLHAPLMIVGEGPGQQEDLQGEAFVGPAGQLLTKMLMAIDLPRERVYIGNVVKCRPPSNRQPTLQEADACIGHLRKQYQLIKPQVILLLGATAVRSLLGEEYRITKCRGQWFEKKGCEMIATFHPSALLRDPSKKAMAWEDLKVLKQKLIEKGLYQDLWEATKP